MQDSVVSSPFQTSPPSPVGANGHPNGAAKPAAKGGKKANGHSAAVAPADLTPPGTTCFLSEVAKVTEIDGIRGLMPFETEGVITFLYVSIFVHSAGDIASHCPVSTHTVPLPRTHPPRVITYVCHIVPPSLSQTQLTPSAGRPNPQTFPFNSITLHIKPPLGGQGMPESVELDGPLLDQALQYGPSPGLPAVREWLSNLQTEIHGRQPGNWAISMGSGCQDLMSKSFGAVLNPGDPILVETPVYSGVLPALRQLHAEMVEVEVDDQGLSAKSLEGILAAWPADKKRPRVIYSTPVGCNPSGCSASKQRKLDVLEVMKRYDLLMLEDDPYYYLTEPLIPSYFGLETAVFPEGGHVVRFDSFSKLLSGGMRLGFATGPKDILHAIDVQTAGMNLHTSGLTQAIAYRLLDHWGIQGFLSHARAVAAFYAARRDVFEAAAKEALGDLARWVSPVAGMFLWIDMSPAGITDSFSLIRNEALAKGVLAVPGQAFYPSGRKSSHVRVSFSIIDLDDEAPEGFRRLAAAIHDKRRELGLE